MSLPNQDTTIVRAAVGTAGTTFPWWNSTLEFLGGAWPVVIQGGGLIVLVLTIRKLWIENKIQRAPQGRRA